VRLILVAVRPNLAQNTLTQGRFRSRTCALSLVARATVSPNSLATSTTRAPNGQKALTRIYLIADNLSAHKTPDIRASVRLAALAPNMSPAEVLDVVEHLRALVRVAEGAPDAGPIAALPACERFGWLAAPSSTLVQASEVHTGLSADPSGYSAVLASRYCRRSVTEVRCSRTFPQSSAAIG
jgi:hypothetical protein